MEVSVICVYNDEDALNSELVESLKNQGCEHELVLIDNRAGKFTCAADALNYGAAHAKGNILIFSHQDIYFKTSNELKRLADVISEVDIGDIVGTQGVIDKNYTYYSNLTAGKVFDSNLNNTYHDQKICVSCIDEGLFGMKRETWEKHHFDSLICNNWHLYAVEVCLHARKNKHKIWVAPIQIHHFSYGSISLSYMENLKKLCQRYRADFKYIWTTCYKVKTKSLYINSLVNLWVLNRKMKGIINWNEANI